MSSMDIIKSQFITIFGLRNTMNGNNTSSNSNDGIWNALYAILLLTSIENIFKYIPIIAAFLISRFDIFFKARIHHITNVIPQIKNAMLEVHSIILVRNYSSSKSTDSHSPQHRINQEINIENETVDAMIDYITALDCCKHLRYTNRFILNNNEEIQITPTIRAKLDEMVVESDGTVSRLTLRLYSDTTRIKELRDFVNRIYKLYIIEKKNKLGDQRYYFNEQAHTIDRNFDGTLRIGNLPKRLVFSMVPFNTFKSMNNIFGAHLQEIKDRVELFIKRPEWYKARGIPHTLGILLHGKPGCGKTSIIKAIAKDTNRHIINISLRENTSQQQLTNLFFDETVAIVDKDGNNSTVIIPLDARIYVIEDIDCLTDVCLNRELKEQQHSKHNKAKKLTKNTNTFPIQPKNINLINKTYDKQLEQLEIQKQQYSIENKTISNDALNETRNEIRNEIQNDTMDEIYKTPNIPSNQRIRTLRDIKKRTQKLELDISRGTNELEKFGLMTYNENDLPKINKFDPSSFNKMWEQQNNEGEINNVLNLDGFNNDSMFSTLDQAYTSATLVDYEILKDGSIVFNQSKEQPTLSKHSSINENDSNTNTNIKQLKDIENEIKILNIKRLIHTFQDTKNSNASSIISTIEQIRNHLKEPEMLETLKSWTTNAPIECYKEWMDYEMCNLDILEIIGCRNEFDILYLSSKYYTQINSKTNDDNNNDSSVLKDLKPEEKAQQLIMEDQKKNLINLGFLLNLLDGVLETPGRILIITSNYPEKLDKALVRPGRIDVKIEFGYSSIDMIRGMLEHFYNLSRDEANRISIPMELDYKFSPAQVIEAFCNEYRSYEAGLNSLLDKLDV